MSYLNLFVFGFCSSASISHFVDGAIGWGLLTGAFALVNGYCWFYYKAGET